MAKLNDEVQETSKINVELVTETEQLKEQIETMSRATTARSHQLDESLTQQSSRYRDEFRPPSLHAMMNLHSGRDSHPYDPVVSENNEPNRESSRSFDNDLYREPYNEPYGDEDRRTSTVGSDYQLSNVGSQHTAYPTPTAF